MDQPEHGKLVHKAVLHGNFSSATLSFITTKKRKLPMWRWQTQHSGRRENRHSWAQRRGKSTLLQMLAGMRIAQQGQVRWITSASVSLIRRICAATWGAEPDRETLFRFAAGKPDDGEPEASDEDIERALTLSGALPLCRSRKTASTT